MKKIIYLLLIIIYFLSGSINEISAKEKKIKMQFFNVPPHAFLDKKTGKVTGAVFEFINDYIAPEMRVRFIWDKEFSNIPRQINTLKTQPGYAGALIIYSPKRSKIIDYTKTPYFRGQSVLIVHKRNTLKKILKVEDILHIKIGYANKSFLTPFMKNEKIQFDMISHPNFNEANLRKLLKNRIDAVYAPEKTSLLYVIKNLNAGKEVKVVHLPERPAPFHIAFSKGSKKIVEKYNRAFDKLDGHALYLRLVKKYIDISLFN